MRANKRRILPYTATRGILGRLASVVCGLEKDVASEVFKTLIGEIQALDAGDCNSDIWRQATSRLDGPESYGLERIGLWPSQE